MLDVNSQRQTLSVTIVYIDSTVAGTCGIFSYIILCTYINLWPVIISVRL